MQNKKGTNFTVEETVKMIFAVLGIIILVYVGYKVTTILLDKNEAEQAQEFLEKIEESRVVLEGEISEIEFLVFNPSGWYLNSFSNEGKNYLCISPKKVFPETTLSLFQHSSVGFCRGFDSVSFQQNLIYDIDREGDPGKTNDFKNIEIKRRFLPLSVEARKSGGEESKKVHIIIKKSGANK
jgi:hypothetical protein